MLPLWDNQLVKQAQFPFVLMLQIGPFINQEFSQTVAQLTLTMLLSLLDIKLMEFGLLEIHGEQLGENKDILDLLAEIPAVFLTMQ